MNVHHVKDLAEDFPVMLKMVPPQEAFIKHLLCQTRLGDWDPDPDALLCPEEHLVQKPFARIVLCPPEEVAAYLDGTWPEGARNQSRQASAAVQRRTASRRQASL
jgi:hypothetical protein